MIVARTVLGKVLRSGPRRGGWVALRCASFTTDAAGELAVEHVEQCPDARHVARVDCHLTAVRTAGVRVGARHGQCRGRSLAGARRRFVLHGSFAW